MTTPLLLLWPPTAQYIYTSFGCNPSQLHNEITIFIFKLKIKHTVVIDRPFGSAELFGQTSTVRFGPNDRTFFCRTQNFFHGNLSYFCFA